MPDASAMFGEKTTCVHRAWVVTDGAALERNLGKIKAALPPHVRYMAVVKADAYGHGALHTVTRLLQSGVDCFCVANGREGAEVRELGPGSEILVLGPLLPEEMPTLAAYDLTASISTREEMLALSVLAGQYGRRIPVHVKVDTGMGRMGTWYEDAPDFIGAVLGQPSLELRGIYTHFSSAGMDAPFTSLQRQRFVGALSALPGSLRKSSHFLIHADNSAGLETFASEGPFNAVRVGLLQYGLPPHRGSLLKRLKPEAVLSFHSRVGLVKNLPRGTSVSYDRTHTLARDTRVAIVTAGYGDGIPVSASNKAQVLIHGQRCPVLGRVTMDQTVVDASDLAHVAVGDTVTLIGKQGCDEISVSEFCAWAGMIPWDVFCSITKRVERVPTGLRG
ncbi:MAG: alanine racemase [Puniceicoccales bacterium]|nr:alanine racemase [Puniceicoccales bacterium]